MGPHLRRMQDVPLARLLVGALRRARDRRQRRQLPCRGRARRRRGGRGRRGARGHPRHRASAPGSSRAAGCCTAPTASPASPATWWSTRTDRRARAASGAAGSGSRRAPGSAGWPATRPAAGGSTPRSRWPAATPRRCAGEHVTASARAGDAESQAVLDELAHWIALGLANLVNVLDPAVIVIGGGLVEAADLLLPEVRRRFADLVMAGEQRPRCRSCRPSSGSGRAPSAPRSWRPRPSSPATRRPLPSVGRLACRIEHSCHFSGTHITATGGTVSRTLRRAIAVLTILVLAASGCGNSGDDDVLRPRGRRRRRPAPSGEEERDTFVAISGVPGRDRRRDLLRRHRHADAATRSAPASSTATSTASRRTSPSATPRAASSGATSCSARSSTTRSRNNQAQSLEVASSDDYFGAFQATLLATGWGDLDDAGVPTYTWGIHATEAANRPHIFPSTVIQCGDCTGRARPVRRARGGCHEGRVARLRRSARTRRSAPTAVADVGRALRRRHRHRGRLPQRRPRLRAGAAASVPRSPP